MDAAEFFSTFAQALRAGQPHMDDVPVVSRIARLGITPGENFAMARHPEPVRSAVEEGVRAAKQKIATISPRRPLGGNWLTSDMGVYRTQYLLRARVAKFGLGALPPEDARYAQARVDADGAPLNGSHRYLLSFERGQFPPVQRSGRWHVAAASRSSPGATIFRRAWLPLTCSRRTARKLTACAIVETASRIWKGNECNSEWHAGFSFRRRVFSDQVHLVTGTTYRLSNRSLTFRRTL
jgi:hypothetical protein